jgi:hypothetical protein
VCYHGARQQAQQRAAAAHRAEEGVLRQRVATPAAFLRRLAVCCDGDGGVRFENRAVCAAGHGDGDGYG